MCIFVAYHYALCAHTEYSLFQICPAILHQLLRINDPAELAREDHLPFDWNEDTCSPRPARPEVWDPGNIRWWNVVLAGETGPVEAMIAESAMGGSQRCHRLPLEWRGFCGGCTAEFTMEMNLPSLFPVGNGLLQQTATATATATTTTTTPMAGEWMDDFGVGQYMLPEDEEETKSSQDHQYNSEEDCAYDVDEDVDHGDGKGRALDSEEDCDCEIDEDFDLATKERETCFSKNNGEKDD